MDETIRPRDAGLRRAGLSLVVAVVVAGAVTGGYLGLHRTAASGGGSGAQPAARTDAVMAYDPASGDVVMFGGIGAAGQPLADTWLWDGSAWSQASPASSPPGRFGAQMAWDPQSQRLILLGGTGGSGCAVGGGPIAVPGGGGAVAGPALAAGACTQLQDAWTWDGNDWARLDLGTATGQVGHDSLAGAEMATDPATGRIVLLTSSSAPVSVPPSGPVGSASAGSGIACPMIPAGTSPSASPPVFTCPPLPCRVVGSGGAPTIACPICPAASSPQAGSSASGIACPPPTCPLPPGTPDDGTWTCPVGPSTLTWVFDGSTFHQAASPTTDGPSLGGDLVWFPGPARLADLRSGPEPEMGVPCLQGHACPPFPQDVWEWDGASWRSAAVTAGQEAPSFAASPVTDLSAGDVVGLDGGGATRVSTDPTGPWTEAGSSGPAARGGPAMAYDAGSGQVVLFGGEVWGAGPMGSRPADDTWTWDGHAWTLRGGTPPSPSPSPGPKGSMVPLPAIVSPPSSPDATGASTATSLRAAASAG